MFLYRLSYICSVSTLGLLGHSERQRDKRYRSHPLRLDKAVRAGAVLKSLKIAFAAGLIELLMGCLETSYGMIIWDLNEIVKM